MVLTVSGRGDKDVETYLKNKEMAKEFVEAMLRKAREQKYVSAKPLVTDNEKYSFRVFLNSLGFIGKDNAALRKELLKNLSGSSAWRHPEDRGHH